MLGGSEWIIILLILVLLFGARKIPELGKGLGKGIRSFKDGLADKSDDAGESRNVDGQDNKKLTP